MARNFITFSVSYSHFNSKSKGDKIMASAMEKIVAEAPKLIPVVAPVVTKAATTAAPVVIDAALTVGGAALSIATSPVVLTGLGMYAGYKALKKLFG